MQEKRQKICIYREKALLLQNFLLNDIHNKDYSVVKTFRVGGNSRPFCFEFNTYVHCPGFYPDPLCPVRESSDKNCTEKSEKSEISHNSHNSHLNFCMTILTILAISPTSPLSPMLIFSLYLFCAISTLSLYLF